VTKEFIGKAPESARDYLFEFRLIASDGYKNSSTTDLSVTFKINLFLKVLSKNSEGLHNIQSNVMLLDLNDQIKIRNINKKHDEIKFVGQFKKNIN
jgi:hypothetical protein